MFVVVSTVSNRPVGLLSTIKVVESFMLTSAYQGEKNYVVYELEVDKLGSNDSKIVPPGDYSHESTVWEGLLYRTGEWEVNNLGYSNYSANPTDYKCVAYDVGCHFSGDHIPVFRQVVVAKSKEDAEEMLNKSFETLKATIEKTKSVLSE